MLWWQSVLITVLTSVITAAVTVIVVEPLKQWIGKKMNKKQVDKDKLISFLSTYKGSEVLTTADLQKSVIPRKKVDYVYELLQVLKREGIVKALPLLDGGIENVGWLYIIR